MPIKWNFNSKYSFTNQNFAKIYSFFVIESPVQGASNRGKTFEERETDLVSLSACIKRKIPVLKSAWISESIKNVESKLKEQNIYESVELPREIAIHSKRDDSKTKGLYYTIRCSLAHGAFSIHKCNGESYYFLENKDKETYKGRLVLKESSLIAIIEAVNEANCKSTKKKAKNKGIKKKELITV